MIVCHRAVTAGQRAYRQNMYHEGNRELQHRFDTTRLADRIAEMLIRDRFNDSDRAFIESRDMFFLATADADGQPTCSYKGGDPGFVRILDETTLAFPIYDGNGMYLSSGNVLANPKVGLLFIDFERRHRMRVEGTAELISATDGWLDAQFVIHVTPTAIYPNCPRYIHRMQPVARSEFVPREGCQTPIPDWKRSEWARDVLAADDPAGASSANT